MDTIFRLIGLLAALFTMAATAYMLLTFRKERRIGAVSPLVAMALSLAMLPIFMFLSGARLNLLLAAPALAIGLVLGILRGQTTRLYYRDGVVMGRHSLFFLLGWGASLALSQGATLLGSALLASAALLPLFLSTGTQMGINANLFLRRLVMQLPLEVSSVDVAQIGLPERETPEARLPETTPETGEET